MKSEDLDESDVEETIEIEERELESMDINEELEELRNEGQIDLKDLISRLPEEYLSNIMSSSDISDSSGICDISLTNGTCSIQPSNIPMDISLDCVCSEITIEQQDDETCKNNISDNIIASPGEVLLYFYSFPFHMYIMHLSILFCFFTK